MRLHDHDERLVRDLHATDPRTRPTPERPMRLEYYVLVVFEHVRDLSLFEAPVIDQVSLVTASLFLSAIHLQDRSTFIPKQSARSGKALVGSSISGPSSTENWTKVLKIGRRSRHFQDQGPAQTDIQSVQSSPLVPGTEM